MTATLPESPSRSYGDAFPNSTKVYLEGSRGIRVPLREIALSSGEPPLRVYDTSGPRGLDVREGLPSVRGAWIGERDVGRTGGRADRRKVSENGGHGSHGSPRPSMSSSSCLGFARPTQLSPSSAIMSAVP